MWPFCDSLRDSHLLFFLTDHVSLSQSASRLAVLGATNCCHVLLCTSRAQSIYDWTFNLKMILMFFSVHFVIIFFFLTLSTSMPCRPGRQSRFDVFLVLSF